MLNEAKRPKLDLEERTSKFAKEITLFCELILIFSRILLSCTKPNISHSSFSIHSSFVISN